MFRARPKWGLGDVEQAQYTKLAVSGAQTAISGAATLHLLSAGVAGPIGLAIAGVGIALTMLFSRKGPQQKIETTKIVNEAEPILRDNRDLYLSGPRDQNSYQAALDNFDYTWGQVVSLCSNPNYGDPGQRCISDRQRGGQWDWFSYYRDPITQNPPKPLDVTSLLPALPEVPNWLGPAALIAAGIWMVADV